MDNKSISENAVGSYNIVKMLYIPSMLTSHYQDQSGTGFRLCRCWSIDWLVWWEVTYCVGHGSADTWDYVCLCFVLEWAICVGGMIGCTVVQVVLIVWFYWYVLVRSWCCWWDRICASCLGCVTRMLIEGHCVLCIWYVPDASV